MDASLRWHDGEWREHVAVLAATVAALLVLFARDAAAMAHQWWASSTYQHCLFILPIVAWLVWQRHREVARVEPRAWLPGLLFVALAAFLWLIGEAAGVALVRHAALIALVQASVLAILGPAAVRALLFPLFYLVFLVPFGDEFVPPLQTVTAKITMALLHISGVPARIDGVFITTPSGWFEVAEACSGVKFLVAMVAYGALVANVCFRSWPRRIAFMGLCVVAPILANGVRAFATIYAAHLTSVAAATGFDHIVYGWFFFAFVMALVIAIGWRFFDRRIGDPWLTAIPRAVGKPRNALAVALAALGIAALPIVWNGTVIATQRRPLPHQVFLPQVARWTQVTNTGCHPWTPRFDGADHRLYGRYRDASGRQVDVAIALYGWQGEGRKLAGFGQGAADPDHKWAWAANALAPPGGKAERILAPGRVAREALTFYVLAGGATGDAMTVRLRTLRAHLLGGDQRAGVVIVSAVEPNARPAVDAFLTAFGAPAARARALLDQAD